MNSGKQLAIDHPDCFEPVFLIAQPDSFGNRQSGIIENSPPERQRQVMLFPVRLILGRIIFEVHARYYVNHIAITSGIGWQDLSVSDNSVGFPTYTGSWHDRLQYVCLLVRQITSNCHPLPVGNTSCYARARELGSLS